MPFCLAINAAQPPRRNWPLDNAQQRRFRVESSFAALCRYSAPVDLFANEPVAFAEQKLAKRKGLDNHPSSASIRQARWRTKPRRRSKITRSSASTLCEPKCPASRRRRRPRPRRPCRRAARATGPRRLTRRWHRHLCRLGLRPHRSSRPAARATRRRRPKRGRVPASAIQEVRETTGAAPPTTTAPEKKKGYTYSSLPSLTGGPKRKIYKQPKKR